MPIGTIHAAARSGLFDTLSHPDLPKVFGARIPSSVAHRWDDAEVFAIRYHDGEWAPYSPRSAAGAQPFPAAYVGQEELVSFVCERDPRYMAP
mgnify:CR=1 FL=1